MFPGLASLNDRQCVVLATHNLPVASDADIHDRDRRTIGASQAATRTRPSVAGECVIVTPCAEIFLYDRLRKVTGYESMLLQGIHFGSRQGRLESFSSGELPRLAGNAFNMYCCAAVVPVREIVLATCEQRLDGSCSSS